MHMLVGIPAFNEAPTIADVISKVPRQIEGITSISIVVIDDGSTDSTGSLARQAGAVVVRHPQNSGVGVAFQTMVNFAGAFISRAHFESAWPFEIFSRLESVRKAYDPSGLFTYGPAAG